MPAVMAELPDMNTLWGRYHASQAVAMGKDAFINAIGERIKILVDGYVQREREECAKQAEAFEPMEGPGGLTPDAATLRADIAQAIRQRGKDADRTTTGS